MTYQDEAPWKLGVYQPKLRLQDWDIRHADWDSLNTNESATVHHHKGTRAATIRVDPEVTGKNLDAHIVHELAHLVLSDYTEAAQNAIAKLGPGAEAVLDILGDMEERICDTIAHALTGVTYIPVGEQARKFHAPFVDTSE